MTTIDIHTETAVTADGRTLPLKELSVVLDESWSPYVQGTIVAPLPDDLDDLTAVDPRTAARFLLTIRRDFGDAWSNADFTARHGAVSNAALTAFYGPVTNGAITAQFFKPYNSFGVRATDQREMNLHVRSRVIDHVAKEVRIRLASDEALLQDYKLIATVRYTNTATTLRGLVGYVIGLIGGTLAAGTDDAPITAGASEWLPGVSAWDYLAPLIEKADLRLWCDEKRVWHLTQRAPLAPGHLSLTTGATGTLTEAVDTIDRDGDYYDAVVITYRWTDSAGAQQYAWDVAGTGGLVLSETRDQLYPGPGAAAALLARARGRGRVLDLRAVSDYTATPGQAFSAFLPDTTAQTGVVSAVAWSLPDAEMSVRTRGLIDTPTTAWAFDPPGVSWNDIPVGIDWTEDL